jgi:hypothetical protein
MNTMNIPGFTAEGALCSSHKHYTTRVHTSAHPLSTSSQVTPQLRMGCFIRAVARTYNRCVGLGYDSGACAEVARDLGLSVCDD